MSCSEIEIRDVSLTDDAARLMLTNGNFTLNPDHWVFTKDGHLARRTKNGCSMLFFETGVAAFPALACLTLAAGVRVFQHGSVMGASITAAIPSGMISSLFDTPGGATSREPVPPRLLVQVAPVATND